MLYYKDKTFCTAKCKTPDCSFKLTEEVRKEAIVWWGDENAPIATTNFSSFCDGYIADKPNKLRRTLWLQLLLCINAIIAIKR